MPRPPLDETVTIPQLTADPYPIYRRMRAETPVVRVASVGRTFLTKAVHCQAVKDDPGLFSSDDPETPMKPAFQAHTLMRKDGPEHRRERMAMQMAYMPKVIDSDWAPLYRRLATEYLDRLPTEGTVDLFSALCGPIAAAILTRILGLDGATDEDMQRWSQQLIDGAGNFGWAPEPFAITDRANAEMDAHIAARVEVLRAAPDASALSTMLHHKNPIPDSQVRANLKIAIGGGINEPRDAMATIVYGLLTNPDQLDEVRRRDAWADAFEEGVRWVAPIQASSRRAMEDCQIGGLDIPAGETVMTIQASANRDEDLCENGEVFDVFRPSVRHQSFGSGPHHCMGAQIARRTVGDILLPALFERYPRISLPDPDAVIWRGFGFRGPITLPVRLG